ncbi:MAG: A/G-specific adenine glycosylase [Acidobacteria bacterium]|nr:MAG: A/G-specific adenine glycosylase [Acidobacteriota bacterium]PYY15323.1 MAG: A/G-specific adenine glycosylase [Acidobacteriota bacterium]
MPHAIDLTKPTHTRSFRRNLLTWYREHQRSLPWRKTRDPYRIWVSEIMLQQTRVAAVLEHYKRFLKKFPTVRHLAFATEAEVLAAWSGLGYYRRARMLHRAAKLVATERSGRVPQTAAELRILPGIGRYTANAIASIAFGEPVAVVDGNVERVLERLLQKKLSGEIVWRTAQALLDLTSPGDFNQAMMELGATICIPGVPLCYDCPIKKQCASRGMERKEPPIPGKRMRRSSSLLLVRRRDAILLQQRAHNERFMPGMWELPEAASEIAREPLLRVKHSITTSDWSVSVFSGPVPRLALKTHLVPLAGVSQLPITGLTRKILRKLNLLS